MPVSVISVKCPDCGKTCNLEEFRSKFFCSYCGAQILINNENEYTVRYIDEADIKRAETEQMVQQHEIKMDEENKHKKHIPAIVFGMVSIALIAVGVWGAANDKVGLVVFGFFGLAIGLAGFCIILDDKERSSRKITRIVQSGDIEITEILEHYDGKNYRTVKALFSNAGFTSITKVPLYDLSFTSRKNEGLVEEVSIDGTSDFSKGDTFSNDAKVIITYHSRKK